MHKGFTFNGRHSSEFDITLSGKIQIRYPKKVKVIERLTGTNTQYDFSEVNGVQQYEERTVVAPVNIVDRHRYNYQSAQLRATQIINWLMAPNQLVPLFLDEFPEYYFLAEVRNQNDFEVNLFGTGQAEIEFTAYPFKIRNRLSNSDEWATFNFLTDVRQDTRVILPTIHSQIPMFKEVPLNSLINIGGWAQIIGDIGRISRYDAAQSYLVTEMRTKEPNYETHSFSSREYFAPELNAWVSEQDIIQARGTYGELELFNGGITLVRPDIVVDRTPEGSDYGGYTIEKNGRFYNFKNADPNRLLTLDVGFNQLKVYGQGLGLDFVWRDEVL